MKRFLHFLLLFVGVAHLVACSEPDTPVIPDRPDEPNEPYVPVDGNYVTNGAFETGDKTGNGYLETPLFQEELCQNKDYEHYLRNGVIWRSVK